MAIMVVGVEQALDSGMDAQVAVLEEKATDLGKQIQKEYLP